MNWITYTVLKKQPEWWGLISKDTDLYLLWYGRQPLNFRRKYEACLIGSLRKDYYCRSIRSKKLRDQSDSPIYRLKMFSYAINTLRKMCSLFVRTFEHVRHFANIGECRSRRPCVDDVHHLRFKRLDVFVDVNFHLCFFRHLCYPSSRLLKRRKRKLCQLLEFRNLL